MQTVGKSVINEVLYASTLVSHFRVIPVGSVQPVAPQFCHELTCW